MKSFEFLRRLVRPLVYSYLRPRVQGLEHIPASGPALLAGNHPNVLDGVILGLVSPRPVKFLVAGELFRNPLLGGFLRWAGAVPVDRSGGSNSEALNAATQALEAGEVVGLFPEGRTNNGGPLQDLRPGVAVLARRTGAPVIPFGIAGTERLYPWGSRQVRPGPVALQFAEPSPAGEVQPALDRLRQDLLRCRGQAERLLADAPGPTGPAVPLAGLVLVPLSWVAR